KATFDINSPMPVSSTGGKKAEISFEVSVQNVGDGTVAANLDGEPGTVRMNVSFPNAGDLAEVTGCGGSTGVHTFRLYSGKRDVICTATIEEGMFQTQLSVQADMNYTYFETQETSFQIEGQAGKPGG
ncbi:MAG: hypothetical protein ABEK12_01080, partial [Candidatus Nanohaloarchaea archaeon]